MGWLLDPLFTFLKCLVLYAVGLMKWMLFGLINLLIQGIMALVGLLLAILPDWSPPTLTLPNFVGAEGENLPWLAWANWFIPLDQALLAVQAIVLILGLWWLVNVGLRWAKAAH